MSHSVVYSFSGTGNSFYASQKVAQALGADLKFIVHEYTNNQFSCEAENIIFCFPVYYWGPPVIVRQFVEKLQMPNASYISVLANANNNHGACFAIMQDLLQAKGKTLDYGFGILMPSNYLPLFSVKNADEVQTLNTRAERRIDRYIERVKKMEKNGPFKPGWRKILYNLFHRRPYTKDKKFFVTDACTRCGLCAKVCPANDIKMTPNGPLWQHKCWQCMACANYCPVRAIQIKWALTNKQGRYHHPDINAELIASQK